MAHFNNSFNFPAQKKSRKQKDKKWGMECINNSEKLARYSNDLIRQTFYNKVESYDLYNGVINEENISKTLNMYGFKDKFPAKMQNYPITVPKIDLMLGEERTRPFNYNVVITNDDGVSAKERRKAEEIKTEAERIISTEFKDEASLSRAIEDLQSKYNNYNYQDIMERTASHILEYLYTKLEMKEMFSSGFEDLIISSEEIYCVEIEAGQPIVRRVNPCKLSTVRSGESPWIDDSDIIYEDRWMSPGQVVDAFHDYLTQKQVDIIDKGINSGEAGGRRDFINIGEQDPAYPITGLLEADIRSLNTVLENTYDTGYDANGNYRVVRCVWKSMRKVGYREYTDKNGEKQSDFVSEKYKAKEGESVTWRWISEWWEGTRIGGSCQSTDDSKDAFSGIFVKIRPREVQLREAGNISKCHSGYVGVSYNVNTSRALSMMDRMKPYQYLYDVMMYRLELAIAKNKGVLGVLPMQKKPKDISLQSWLHYAEANGWLLTDDFNEVTKGASTGKLAGQMSGSGSSINLSDNGQANQIIGILEYVEQKMSQIVGITPQREGSIQSRETVRGVERSINQSSTITEKWFSLHNQVKTRVMNLLLATAKHAWKDDEKVLQFVTDELGSVAIKVDGSQKHDLDFRVYAEDSRKGHELMSEMRELMTVAIQSDKLDFSTALDIINNKSTSKVRRNIEVGEKRKKAEMQEQQQQAMQQQQQAQQAEAQKQQADQQFEIQKLQVEHQQNMELEQLKIDGKLAQDENKHLQDLDKDGIPDQFEMERDKANKDLELIKQEKDLAFQRWKTNEDNKTKIRVSKKNSSSK